MWHYEGTNLKTFSGLRVTGMVLTGQSDFTVFEAPLVLKVFKMSRIKTAPKKLLQFCKICFRCWGDPMMVKYYFLCYTDMHYFVIQFLSNKTKWVRSFSYPVDHGLINYRDTKAKYLHLIIWSISFGRSCTLNSRFSQLIYSTVLYYATVYYTDS